MTAVKARLDKRPSIDRVRQILAYDRETGILTWKVTSGRAIAGREAGGIDSSTGYHRVKVERVTILSHHVAWAIEMGEWPERIDHRLGKEAGNAWSNLRLATQSQNMSNRGAQPKTVTGVKGVSYHKVTGKWQAQIGLNGENKYLGVFDTIEGAKAAYDAAATLYFGDFSRSA